MTIESVTGSIDKREQRKHTKQGALVKFGKEKKGTNPKERTEIVTIYYLRDNDKKLIPTEINQELLTGSQGLTCGIWDIQRKQRESE